MLFTATTVHPGFPGKSRANPRDTTPKAPRPITFSILRFARGISHSISPENDGFNVRKLASLECSSDDGLRKNKQLHGRNHCCLVVTIFLNFSEETEQ